MKAILQRVSQASVTIGGQTVGQIQKGLVILLGIAQQDTWEQAKFLAEKTAHLRIFSDEQDKMNRSVLDIAGAVLVISNFTLCADCKKGRRPSFTKAMDPAQAEQLYEYYMQCLKDAGVLKIEAGRFGADMMVNISNDGPVTFILDTDEIM